MGMFDEYMSIYRFGRPIGRYLSSEAQQDKRLLKEQSKGEQIASAIKAFQLISGGMSFIEGIKEMGFKDFMAKKLKLGKTSEGISLFEETAKKGKIKGAPFKNLFPDVRPVAERFQINPEIQNVFKNIVEGTSNVPSALDSTVLMEAPEFLDKIKGLMDTKQLQEFEANKFLDVLTDMPEFQTKFPSYGAQ